MRHEDNFPKKELLKKHMVEGLGYLMPEYTKLFKANTGDTFHERITLYHRPNDDLK